MLIAARESFAAASRRHRWTNPYVTDGLIAMWDGQWNAGGGVHDAGATTWADLSGNGYDISVDNNVFAWTQNSIQSPNSSFLPLEARAGAYSVSRGTIEAVFKIRGVSGSFGRVWSGNVDKSDYRFALLVSSGTPSMAIQCGSIRGSKFAEIGVATINVGSIVCASFYRDSTSNMGITVNGSTNYVLSGFSSVYNEPRGLCMFGDNTVTPGNNVSGDIYSMRSYSRALTAAEIAANYTIDRERFNLP